MLKTKRPRQGAAHMGFPEHADTILCLTMKHNTEDDNAKQ